MDCSDGWGSHPTADDDVYRTEVTVGERLPMSVVRAVAAYTGRKPTTLAPLAEAVAPQALDRLVRGREGSDAPTVTVQFQYEGFSVRTDGDRICLEQCDEAAMDRTRAEPQSRR